MEAEGFRNLYNSVFERLAEIRCAHNYQLCGREVGEVLSFSGGIAAVSGLAEVGFEELVEFPNDLFGIVFNLTPKEVGVVLLGDYSGLRAGDLVRRTGRVADVPVGPALLGRVLDPLGRPLDGKEAIQSDLRWPLERVAAPIVERSPVVVPLQTGIKAIDSFVPIGRGQRELILGDRQTGKTAIAVATILNQRDTNVVCIYCSIGQRSSSVAKVIADLRSRGGLDKTIIIVAEGHEAPGLSFIAPYAATSMAEYFMENGRDVLVVYDDLTRHARAYREICLLLRRPPGREAFPGDVFYIHARLLERATHLCEGRGGGSLTALPIVETEAQNIAAYIPTNLISITDGQIYLSPTLFCLGVLPPVDVGKSVSRVGGKAQLAAYRSVAGSIKLSYAQFEELENFARFGTRLDEHTRGVIEHGQRLRACLSQLEFETLSVSEQVILFLALTEGLFDPLPLESMRKVEELLRGSVKLIPKPLLEKVTNNEKWSEEEKAEILVIVKSALSGLGGSSG
jgi:F-type H+-transporting ATPase subunit alpha